MFPKSVLGKKKKKKKKKKNIYTTYGPLQAKAVNKQKIHKMNK